MNEEIKRILFIIIGVFISVIIPILGLYLTNVFENGFAITLSLIVLPFIGFFTFKSKYKSIGVGIFIGLIPIGILAFIFAVASQLH